MEDRQLETLKAMLTKRGVGKKEDQFENVATPLDQTRMYLFGGVLIVFSEKTRLTDTELNNFITYASENNHTAGMIVVTPTNPSEKVLKVLREYIGDRKNPLVQIFYQSHLNFDISEHRKVPKHRILSDDEVTKLAKEFNIADIRKIRKIDCQDPMARWIGARPGDVIEVSGLCMASAEGKHWDYCVSNVYEN